MSLSGIELLNLTGKLEKDHWFENLTVPASDSVRETEVTDCCYQLGLMRDETPPMGTPDVIVGNRNDCPKPLRNE